MKEPERIPLTDNPRPKQINKIPLNSNELWEVYETKHGPPILAKNNENHLENNSQSIQKLETDQVD